MTQQPGRQLFRVFEQEPNGLWDVFDHSDEGHALADASYIRRNRPGRRVVVVRYDPTPLRDFSADDLHPRLREDEG